MSKQATVSWGGSTRTYTCEGGFNDEEIIGWFVFVGREFGIKLALNEGDSIVGQF